MTPPTAASRRKFIRKAALTVGAFTIVPRFVLGKGFTPPSDKFTIAFVGTGKQGRGLANRFTQLPAVQIVGACDVEQQKLALFGKIVGEKYAAVQGMTDYKGLFTTGDYLQIVDREGIDGIVVATPDHWHAAPAIAALNAGKHVYCEKPLSHTLEEGRAMVDAARKNNKVLQTGSMQRSNDNFRKACELVRNGYVGEITKVLVSVGDPARPCDLPAEPQPAHLDWDRWVGPAEMRPFNAILSPPVEEDIFPRWRWYREFGGGILADWGAHMFDIAQWGLGMDDSGPVELIPPKDPAALRGVRMIYANGVEMVHEEFDRGWGVRFIGTGGTLDISRQYLDSKPENIVTATIKDGETHLYKSEDHYMDWVNAARNGTRPICDAEIGHRSAAVCHLGNIAYRLGRTLTWDPVKEKFKGDGAANKLRSKKYRKPYKLS
ncbi:MAG TPA: Gfo/Idh/MocA family oxidoreductase [Flavilitoribacter sp.]|nr:Gfo/Idh/MocA family oxidoreductase [Flavilitoribacter sp.]